MILVFYLHVFSFQFISKKKTWLVMSIGYYIALKVRELENWVTDFPVLTSPLFRNPDRIRSRLSFAVF